MAPDIVVVVVTDDFTESEMRLAKAGRLEEVRASRRKVGAQLELILRTLVEGATGRRVLTALSQLSSDGVAAEVFTLG